MAAEAPMRSFEGYEDPSENYAWVGYDLECRIGFFAHLGRWSLNREMWREQLYVYLPDRTVLAYRGFGCGDTTSGPAAGVQRQRCLDPGKRWSIQHDGPTWRLDPRELVRGQALEPVVERLELDLLFLGDFAPFMYPASDNTTWGQWHYEQAGSFNGSVRFGDLNERIEGFAFRDHTRGPRNLIGYRGSNWMHGLLPDGTAWTLFQAWQDADGRVEVGLQELTLTTADTVESATVLAYPELDSLDDLEAPVQVAFESSHGRIEMTCEPLNTMIFSATSRYEILLGAARGVAPLVVAEQPMLVNIGGETALAICERGRIMSTTEPKLAIASVVDPYPTV
jgi:hypothetical protein